MTCQSGPDGPSINELTLTVTERCNQRCDYCYVDTEGGRTMSMDVAERALGLLFESAPAGETVGVSFFGGEPLLVPGLLRRIALRARELAGPKRRIRFAVTTNGTAVDGAGLALLEELDMKVAVSHDGAGQSCRPLASGGDSLPDLGQRLPGLLGLPGAPLARMTVTPQSVHRLAESVREVHRAGFGRVLYLPAFELTWDDVALAAWKDQHARLVTWLVGRHNAGRPAPDLPAWRGILGLLDRGGGRQHCGAGRSQITVSVDGRVYPCYRSVYDPRGDDLVLGDVWEGLRSGGVRDEWAALDPARLRPEAEAEAGGCDTCEAAQGCGFFCPALGHLMLGDATAVPRSACDLTRVQVAACRKLRQLTAHSGSRRARRARRPRRRWMAAALAAAFLGGGAACDRHTVGASGDASTDADGTIGPGVCPVGIDSGAADGSIVDSAVVDAALYDATIGPGICLVEIDAGHLQDAHIGPGLCPFIPDAGDPEDGGMPPGIC